MASSRVTEGDTGGDANHCRRSSDSRMNEHHLLGMGEPDDIAHIALLASDEARTTTGAIFPGR
jgi:hypothetical protein